MRSRLAAACLAALLCCVGQTAARPFTIEDLLTTESFGAAGIDPSGRWLVFEQRDPYVTARRFDYNTRTSWGLSRLKTVDLQAPLQARPALAVDPGPGVLMGAFSPGGARLAVYRLDGTHWTLGILTLATGDVRWLRVTPQETGPGRALQWLSDDALLVIARRDGLAPLTVRRGFVLAERLPGLWAAAARGDGAHEVLGSGRYLEVRRRAPDADLLRVEAATGRTTVLASGAFTDLELSPDHRRVALLAAGADLQPRPDGPVRGLRGLETEANALEVLDLWSGELSRPCRDCDLLPQLLSWSPSGRRLLVLSRGVDGLWSSGRLTALDVASGRMVGVAAGLLLRLDQNPVGAWTAWMGEDPLVLARRPGGARDDWFRLGAEGPVNLTRNLPATPEARLRAASGQLLTVVAGGEVWTVTRSGRVLSHGPGGVTGISGVRSGDGARLDRSPDEPVLVRRRTSSGEHLGRLTAQGLRPSRLTVREGGVVASTLTTAAVVVARASGVEQLQVASGQGTPVPVAQVNARLADTDVMEVRAVRHTDVDGRDMTSWLYLPTGRAGRLPVLVRPYLGAGFGTAPRDPPGELGFPLNLRLLTAHGYAVLVPSLPRPSGGLVEPTDRLAERILRAVDAAATDTQVGDRLDTERLAIVGYSFGGYTVMATLAQTDRFRAGVSLSGISDLTALWGGLSPFSAVEPEGGYTPNWRAGGVENTQTRLGRPPWEVPERYRRNSPLYAADQITTPLMLVHGAQDQIPIAQSEAMYAALFRQGKDAVFVTYFGALHTLTSPGDVRDVYVRLFAFLDEHLGHAN